MPSTVLFIAPDMFGPPGGIARYGQMVSKSLVEAGIDLEVITLLDTGLEIPKSWKENAHFRYKSSRGSRFNFILRGILAAISRRPDIILIGHVNFAPLGYLLAKITGAKWATFIYGIDVWRRLRMIRRLALRLSDLIIAISGFTAQKSEEVNGVDRRKIRILYNCISPDFVKEIVPKQVKTRTLSILTVARLTQAERYKGHDYVIRAVSLLKNRFPDLIYHIVGTGDWQPELETLAKELGVSNQVLFHGRVSEMELLEHYRSASIFVMPSRCEGFGFVFIEAMAHGLPVIGGNLDASPEVIVNGQTGFLVDPTSVESIVNAVTTLLETPGLHEVIGQAAVSHVKDKFGFNRFQETLLQYLDEMVGYPFKSLIRKA